MRETTLPTEGRDVTDSEPTPAPRTAGVGSPEWPTEEPTEGPSRTGAHVRARERLSIPIAPILHTLFVSDGPSPLRETLPRVRQQLDYAWNGDWCSPEATKVRAAYVIVTAVLAAPITVALDLAAWATFPLGRLALTAVLAYLIFGL